MDSSELDRQGKRPQRFVDHEISSVKSYLSHDKGSCGGAKSTSSRSSLDIKVKLETAKARMLYAKREAELRKEKAKTECKEKEIEAELNLLNDERLYAEAIAENEVYETLSEWHEEDKSDSSILGKTNRLTSMDRTIDYVMTHSIDSKCNAEVMSTVNDNTCPPNVGDGCVGKTEPTFQLNPLASSYNPETTRAVQSEINIGKEFSQFLVKKDLLMTRFTKFLDDPVTYHVWKETFKSITSELGVTPSEEMDLLVKWLGPESSKQALNLRAASAHDPTSGLKKIWDRLNERYGAPELIESCLRKKLDSFPKLNNREYKKLYDLSDILSEIESAKDNHMYSNMLAYYDSSVGVNPIVQKLPFGLQTKWAERGRKYKSANLATFPPFHYFVTFVKEMCSHYNDPSFSFDSTARPNKDDSLQRQIRPMQINTRKSEVIDENPKCPIHTYASHSLDSCREFRKKTIEDRRQFLKDKGLCFKCCSSDKHTIKNCDVSIKCSECGSVKHTTALHIFKNHSSGKEHDTNKVNCNCLRLCGNSNLSKSCAKIVKAYIYHKENPIDKVKVYALIDDQSNRTLANSSLFESFKDACNFDEIQYSLAACSGKITTTGRLGKGFMIESLDGVALDLPPITECADLPNNRDEIPTPDIANSYCYLKGIAAKIPELDDEAEIQLLIGRDLAEAHHIENQIVGPDGPYAQKLRLGWVLVGETCLGDMHTPNLSVTVNKTFVRGDGRQSILPLCENKFTVKHSNDTTFNNLDTDIFFRSQNDNRKGLSVEDRSFIDMMHNEVSMNDRGYWIAPLPFRTPRPVLPNNREMALKRALYLDSNLKRNPTKKEHFVKFMEKVLASGAAEEAPPRTLTSEVWYLPIFGVYHPKKPGKIRGVFDSSATYRGVSLNNVLLSGPNLINSLLNILLRFRKDSYAVVADIEQMFYSFLVKTDQRDVLRFFWYKNNNPDEGLVEYRMCAHVFGNSPSPAVATFCLRKTVHAAENDVKEFVNNDFYVDDGLTSLPSSEEAISLIKRTQMCLGTANLRLHKIASNSKDVMAAFPGDDLQSELKSLNFDTDLLPINQTLGLSWDLACDCFKFIINHEVKPYTRRGLLSTLNSIYDPLGFVAPIIVRGKILLREMTTGSAWDDPLKEEDVAKWTSWIQSLKILKDLSIPRLFIGKSLSKAAEPILYIFSDASEKAISVVAYIGFEDDDNYGFVMGRTKLTPVHGHTIPRLELCAALLAAETGDNILEALGVSFKAVKFYIDSKVVLGYLNNTTRRFFNYVSNRVHRILSLTDAHQWHYINTKVNPADIGSRGCSSLDQIDIWIKGPQTLSKWTKGSSEQFDLVVPDNDREIRPEIVVHKVGVSYDISAKFELFSSWQQLVTAFYVIKAAIQRHRTYKNGGDFKQTSDQDSRKATEQFILKTDQKHFFSDELKCLVQGKSVSKNSPISSLNPYLDNDGIMRVGGRIGQSCLPVELTNPVLLSSKSHIATLVIRHYHDRCQHQGRFITEGAIRNNGFWIVGARRLISKILHRCVICRKLRGKTMHQIMADLPAERLKPSPPFTYVGVDVFGPWEVVSRRTRGGLAHSKRWAVLFTCLTIRAVHIEVIEEMSSSSFINALRRFISLRGDVKEFRSDRGTNFVGATEDLNIDVINVEDGPVCGYLKGSNIRWKFNAPHSSHMGGVWERMIGIARRILDKMLLGVNAKNLTHEALVTFMAEVCAVMNSRPITPILSDSHNTIVLTPAILLNQKTGGKSEQYLDIDPKLIYKKQWQQVQALSNMFWGLWRDRYLQTLQYRRKWKTPQPNVKEGDIVLLKDKTLARNEWLTGIVEKTIQSRCDKKVRKAEVRTLKDGKSVLYTRPIVDMILLID